MKTKELNMIVNEEVTSITIQYGDFERKMRGRAAFVIHKIAISDAPVKNTDFEDLTLQNFRSIVYNLRRELKAMFKIDPFVTVYGGGVKWNGKVILQKSPINY